MLDITWNLFSRTGNIEAYLLLKELEQLEQERPVKKEPSQTSIAENIDLPSV